jgi:hypothetical protein
MSRAVSSNNFLRLATTSGWSSARSCCSPGSVSRSNSIIFFGASPAIRPGYSVGRGCSKGARMLTPSGPRGSFQLRSRSSVQFNRRSGPGLSTCSFQRPLRIVARRSHCCLAAWAECRVRRWYGRSGSVRLPACRQSAKCRLKQLGVCLSRRALSRWAYEQSAAPAVRLPRFDPSCHGALRLCRRTRDHCRM